MANQLSELKSEKKRLLQLQKQIAAKSTIIDLELARLEAIIINEAAPPQLATDSLIFAINPANQFELLAFSDTSIYTFRHDPEMDSFGLLIDGVQPHEALNTIGCEVVDLKAAQSFMTAWGQCMKAKGFHAIPKLC